MQTIIKQACKESKKIAIPQINQSWIVLNQNSIGGGGITAIAWQHSLVVHKIDSSKELDLTKVSTFCRFKHGCSWN
jgi:hypothetical protein